MVGHWNPFSTKKQQKIYLMNDGFTMLSLYHIITFTQFVPDPETRNWTGISLNVLLAVAVTANATIMLKSTCNGIIR